MLQVSLKKKNSQFLSNLSSVTPQINPFQKFGMPTANNKFYLATNITICSFNILSVTQTELN